MMAIDIQAIADKNSAGQKQKYVEAMSAIAEAAEEAEMFDGEEERRSRPSRASSPRATRTTAPPTVARARAYCAAATATAPRTT